MNEQVWMGGLDRINFQSRLWIDDAQQRIARVIPLNKENMGIMILYDDNLSKTKDDPF